jgi:uncharacterized protein
MDHVSDPAPMRPRRWGLGAFLLAEATYLAVSLAYGYLVIGDGPIAAPVIAAGIAVPTLLAAGLALAITRLRGNGPRADLRLSWSWRDVGLGVLFGVAGLFVTIPASIVYVQIVGADANSAVGSAFSGVRTTWLWAAVVFAVLVVVAPFCEEVLFRGLLWGALERRWGRWWAFGISTLVFALAHFELTRAPLLLVVAIPIALARLYTGRLLAGIVAHGVTNTLPAIAVVLGLLGMMPPV